MRARPFFLADAYIPDRCTVASIHKEQWVAGKSARPGFRTSICIRVMLFAC